MARVGGRNAWIAVPAGLVCAGIVAALVYLAAPMVPTTVTWVGDTLRAATAVPQAPPEAAPVAASDHPDCRDLYPDDLWMELVWTPRALLSQSRTAPATDAAALIDALAPQIVLTCSWHSGAGAVIASTLARVGADAAAVAEAGLRGEGFACGATPDGGVSCLRLAGRTLEEHVVRDGLWLSSYEQDWQPADYGERLAAQVWG